MSMFCGRSENAQGRPIGSPTACLRRGVGVGLASDDLVRLPGRVLRGEDRRLRSMLVAYVELVGDLEMATSQIGEYARYTRFVRSVVREGTCLHKGRKERTSAYEYIKCALLDQGGSQELTYCGEEAQIPVRDERGRLYTGRGLSHQCLKKGIGVGRFKRAQQARMERLAGASEATIQHIQRQKNQVARRIRAKLQDPTEDRTHPDYQRAYAYFYG